jgi:hypothetical protein
MTGDEFSEFEQLVDSKEGKNELACAAFLTFAGSLLMGQTPIALVEMKEEQRSYYGDNDYVVSADLKSVSGQRERVVVLWELKAPQCLLMERDDNANRFRPTKDLLKAETQLIHYLHQAQQDADFRARYEVIHPNNVRAGGIIIGRASSITRGDDAEQRKAVHSLRIRDEALYRPNHIQVRTWDWVLDAVRPLS